MDTLIRRLESKVKDIQFDIDWMITKNKETLIYEDEEIQREIGKKKGILMSIQIVKTEILEREQAEKLKKSMDSMMGLLDKMHQLVDNYEKQPKPDTPAVEV